MTRYALVPAEATEEIVAKIDECTGAGEEWSRTAYEDAIAASPGQRREVRW